MSNLQDNVVTTVRENRTAIIVTALCIIFIGFVLVWPNLFKTAQPSKIVTVEAPAQEEEVIEPEIATPDMDSIQVNAAFPKIEVPVTPETPETPNRLTEAREAVGGTLNTGGGLTKEALSGYFVQVGAFASQGNALDLSRRLEVSGWNTRIEARGDGIFAVLVGPEPTRQAVEASMTKLDKSMGLKGFVVQLNP